MSLAHKIALGTAQFGLHYGISNSAGQTEKEEVRKILAYAKKHGVSFLDTAFAYGNSEEVLGQLDLVDFNVITKFPLPDSDNSPLFYIHESLKRLKLEKVYGFMGHNATSILHDPTVWKHVLQVKEEGLADKIGYSLYKLEELTELLDLGCFPDLIQVPFNILDQRFSRSLKELHEQGVEIHTRSCFLQGLFFMEPEKLSSYFDEIKPFLRRLHEEIPDSTERAGYLLDFCLNQSFIDKVVLGVNNLEQLQINLNLVDMEQDIEMLFIPECNEDVLLPYNWPK